MSFEKLENLYNLIEDKKYNELKKSFEDLQPVDIAEFFEEIDEKHLLIAFRLLPKGVAADVFSYLSSDVQLKISGLVNEKEMSDILNDLYFDDKVDFLEEIPANIVRKILKNTSELERKMINQFLLYPEFSAGSIMTIEYVELKKEMLVGEAIESVRHAAPNKETIYTCYVIDAQRHLEGMVSLKNLILADDNIKVGDIMKQNIIFLNTHDDQENVAEQFKKYDLITAPVVDNEKRLVGIITIDDIVDVIEDEATEDFYKMAAVTPSGEEYIDSGVFHLASKRFGWLLLLMISATFTGYIIRSFEATLQSVVILTAFIPMLMNTGGNAGSQASTTVIRSVVLGEVEVKDFFKVLWKEMRISFLVGVVLALFNFVRIIFVQGHSVGIALIVSLTLVCTVILAKMIGGVLPLVAKKLKLDPTIMASPVITTVVDAITLIIYFSFAIWILGLPG